MQIKWRNLFGLMLAIAAFIVLVNSLEPIAAFLATMRAIGPSHTPEEQLKGLLAVGLILVFILSVIRILTANNNSES